MKITPARGTNPTVLADGRTTIVSRFTATERPPEGHQNIEIEMDIQVDNWGRAGCRALSVRALDDEPVTGKTLRGIPLGRLVRAAAAEAASLGVYAGRTSDGGYRFVLPSAEERAEIQETFFEGARLPRRGSPVTEEHLREVAEEYKRVLADGGPPTKTIQMKWHVTRPTASRWVAKARERGFLGPAQPARASG
jgi:hypothetical protein